jgi:porin
MNTRKKTSILVGLFIVVMAQFAQAQSPEVKPLFSGSLSNAGDFFSQTGGNGNGNYGLFLQTLGIAVDGEKGLGSSSRSAYVSIANILGARPNTLTGGTASGISNIETNDISRVKLYEAWIQQEYTGGSAKLGLYDINTEFYVTSVSGGFLNSMLGVGPEFSTAQATGPSIYPNPALGLRLKQNFSKDLYMLVGAMDARPGSEGNVGAFAFDLRDGALLMAEFGHEDTSNGDKCAIGVWTNTEFAPDTANIPKGAYFLHQNTLFGNENALSAHDFFRFGLSNGTPVLADFSASTGLLFKRVFSSKESSQAGLALMVIKTTNAVKTDPTSSGRDFETTLEAYISEEVFPNLFIQPDVQYVFYPAASKANNTLALGARVKYVMNF